MQSFYEITFREDSLVNYLLNHISAFQDYLYFKGVKVYLQ